MHSLLFLQERIGRAFGELSFPENPEALYNPVRYTLALGGKRIRPLLCLASCDLFEGDIEDAIGPAIGLELFHNFTLLHDDIMDQAPLRRGKETVYKKWNTNVAILSGDTMFAIANRYMLQTKPEAVAAIAELFNTTAIEVCEGQQYDMDFESRDEVSIPQYLEMIRLKTAVLLAASLKTGAIVAGASEFQAQLIYSFGINIGLAFQIKDDWLDVFGKEEDFGKQSGGDIISGKKTFLYLKALELAGSSAGELKSVYNSSSLPSHIKIQEVKAFFRKFSIDQITLNEAGRYYDAGLKALTDLSVSGDRAAVLSHFASLMLNRSF